MPILFRFPNGAPSSETLRGAAGNASSVAFDSTEITIVGSQYYGFGAVTPSGLDESQIDGLSTAIENMMGNPVEGPFSLQEALNRQYPDA